jgi:hypothetical protein
MCVMATRPANDDCASATPLTLGTGTVTVTGSTVGATNSANSCTGAPDVYYSFTLTQREAVYIDAFGSGYDTFIGFATACGAPSIQCEDDACGSLQSQSFGVFDPGTYYIVVDGFATISGGYQLNVQAVPVVGVSAGNVNVGPSTINGNTTGAPTAVAACGTAPSASPEVFYAWITCPSGGGGTFTANTCTGTTWDTVIDEINGDGSGGACNDDTCAFQSTISSTVASGAGIHVFRVSGYNGAAFGAFSAAVNRP